MTDYGEEINRLAEGAWGKYEYFKLIDVGKQEKRGHPLVRCRGHSYAVERLVDGRWVVRSRFFRWRRPDQGTWRSLREEEKEKESGVAPQDEPDKTGKEALKEHVWRFFTVEPDAPRHKGHPWLRQIAFGRWLIPPLNGDAARGVQKQDVQRARKCYEGNIHSAATDDLAALKDQVERGLDRERGRCVLVEQRANFFLTAAGLSTTLVLANAGLLLGTNHLDSPLRQLAALALGVASVCMIAAGLRAMQATTYSFERHLPNGVTTVLDRSDLTGDELTRRYIAEVLTAVCREEVIADWKLARLSQARSCFLLGVGGVMLLTAFVLIEVL